MSGGRKTYKTGYGATDIAAEWPSAVQEAPDYAGHSEAHTNDAITDWRVNEGAVLPDFLMPDRRAKVWRDILLRHNTGEAHTSIAKSYGVTRERIRQIVNRCGGKPRSQLFQERLNEAVKVLEEGKSTISKVSSRFGIGEDTIRKSAKLRGVHVPTDGKMMRFIAKKKAAGYVLLGASYGESARRVGLTDQTVAAYCKSIGVKSRHEFRGNAAIAKAEGHSDA